MPNPLTAERAREIAQEIEPDPQSDLTNAEREVISTHVYRQRQKISLALTDTAIETLEACAKERCGACMRGSVPTYDSGRYYHDIACLAQYEQRELTRLRKERETLTAGSRTIAE